MAQQRSGSKSRGGDGDGGHDRGDRQNDVDVPLIQWIISGIAVLVVLGSFGLIAYDGLIARSGPAAVSVAVDSIARTGELFRVHVNVRNDGGSAAADVQVSGSLRSDPAAATVLRFDYLAAGSERAAVFVFSEDPASAGVRVQVESWGEP